jgi:hypothetical protein
MLVTLSGMVISLNPEHVLNASGPIVSTVGGIMMFFNPVQL